ncbi:MAG: hypothetical protein ABW073_03860 [Acidimicrobiia bacterium]
MSGPTVLPIRPMPPAKPRISPRSVVIVVLAGLFVVSTATLVVRFVDSLAPLDAVAHVTVQNRSDLLIDTDVSDGTGDGWLPISIADPHGTTKTEEIIDQGDTWRFRFRAAGLDGGTISMSRAELEQANWTVTIPESAVAKLHQEGATSAVTWKTG